MPYVSGSSILANDLNSYLETVRNVYGVGTGTRGYGQSAVTQANVVTGTDTVRASHWSNLTSMITTCATQQGTSVSLPTIAAGGSVVAAAGLASAVTAIDTNRLTAAAGSMTLVSAARTITRGTTWTSTITCTARATFASENAMRYFFNAGGQLRVRFAQGVNTTAQDAAWVSIFSGIGTIIISANGTTRSGTLGTASASTGFYQLTTTPAAIFTGDNIGTGAYSTNDVTVNANVGSVTGANGGNGTFMQIAVTLADQHTNAFFDTVRENTQAIFDHNYSSYLSVAQPTWTTDVAF